LEAIFCPFLCKLGTQNVFFAPLSMAVLARPLHDKPFPVTVSAGYMFVTVICNGLGLGKWDNDCKLNILQEPGSK